MRNSAVVSYEPLESVVSFYKEMFGQDVDLYHVVEMSSHFLSTRNCVNVRKYSTILNSSEECLVTLPCFLLKISSVTDTQDYNWKTRDTATGGYGERAQPNVIFLDGMSLQAIDEEDAYGNKTGTKTAYPEQVQYRPTAVSYDYNKPIVTKPKGNYVDYDVVDEYQIKIPFANFPIEVIFEGLHVDSNGFMLIDEHQKEGLAYYIHFLDIQRKYFSQQVTSEMFSIAMQQKNAAVGRMASRGYITSNQKNALANVLMSHNRLVYGFANLR